jgi:nucleoside-diphosphate-sugar epimerase
MIGSAKNLYQLLDVDDLVEAVYLLLVNKDEKRINKEFNIGAAEFGRVEEDLQALFNYANSGSRLIKTPAWPIKKALWVFEKLGISPLYQWVYDTADKIHSFL